MRINEIQPVQTYRTAANRRQIDFTVERLLPRDQVQFLWKLVNAESGGRRAQMNVQVFARSCRPAPECQGAP
jgi:hypothetical protein